MGVNASMVKSAGPWRAAYEKALVGFRVKDLKINHLYKSLMPVWEWRHCGITEPVCRTSN